MRNHYRILFLLLVVVSLAGCINGADSKVGQLRGSIRDAQTGDLIRQEVFVAVRRGEPILVTDGYYLFKNLPLGDGLIEVKAYGYCDYEEYIIMANPRTTHHVKLVKVEEQ